MNVEPAMRAAVLVNRSARPRSRKRCRRSPGLIFEAEQMRQPLDQQMHGPVEVRTLTLDEGTQLRTDRSRLGKDAKRFDRHIRTCRLASGACCMRLRWMVRGSQPRRSNRRICSLTTGCVRIRIPISPSSCGSITSSRRTCPLRERTPTSRLDLGRVAGPTEADPLRCGMAHLGVRLARCAPHPADRVRADGAPAIGRVRTVGVPVQARWPGTVGVLLPHEGAEARSAAAGSRSRGVLLHRHRGGAVACAAGDRRQRERSAFAPCCRRC